LDIAGLDPRWFVSCFEFTEDIGYFLILASATACVI